MRRHVPIVLLLLAVSPALPAGAHPSEFWGEARSPGTRRYLELVAEAESLVREAPRDAIETARSAILIREHRPEAYFVLGLALASQGRVDEAADAFDRFRANDGRPTPPRHVLDAARIYVRAHRVDDAASFVRDVAIRQPKGVERDELYAAYGELLLSEGPDHLDAALRAFRWAVYDVPSPSPRAELGLALALHRNGEVDAAREHAARSVASNSLATLLEASFLSDADKAAARGVVAEAVGQYEAAVQAFEQAAHAEGPWAEHAARARDAAQHHAEESPGVPP